MAPDPSPEPARAPPPQSYRGGRGGRPQPPQFYSAPPYMQGPSYPAAPGPMGYNPYAPQPHQVGAPYFIPSAPGVGMPPAPGMPPVPRGPQQSPPDASAAPQHQAWSQVARRSFPTGAPAPHMSGPMPGQLPHQQQMHSQMAHHMHGPQTQHVAMHHPQHHQQQQGHPAQPHGPQQQMHPAQNQQHPQQHMHAPHSQGMSAQHQSSYMHSQQQKPKHSMVPPGHTPQMMHQPMQPHMGGTHDGSMRGQGPPRMSQPPRAVDNVVRAPPPPREKKIMKIMRPDGSEVKVPSKNTSSTRSTPPPSAGSPSSASSASSVPVAASPRTSATAPAPKVAPLPSTPSAASAPPSADSALAKTSTPRDSVPPPVTRPVSAGATGETGARSQAAVPVPSKALPIVAPPPSKALPITRPPAGTPANVSKKDNGKLPTSSTEGGSTGDAAVPKGSTVSSTAPSSGKTVVADVIADVAAAAEDAKAAAADAKAAARDATAAAAESKDTTNPKAKGDKSMNGGASVAAAEKSSASVTQRGEARLSDATASLKDSAKSARSTPGSGAKSQPSTPNGVSEDGKTSKASEGKFVNAENVTGGTSKAGSMATPPTRTDNVGEKKASTTNQETPVALASSTAVSEAAVSAAGSTGESSGEQKQTSSTPNSSSPDNASVKPSVDANGSGVKNDSGSQGSGDESKDDTPSSPPRRQRPTSVKFKEGERRRYDVDFILDMRPFPATDVAPAYEASINSANLSKWKSESGPAATGGDGRDDPRERGPGPMRGAMYNGGSFADMGNMRGGPRAGVSFPTFGVQSRPLSGPPPGASPGVAAPDAFDLSIARLRAPPPGAQTGGGGGGFNDPRGTGQLAPRSDGRGGRGRLDGPTRDRMGPLDSYQAFTPAEKLVKGERAWARSKENDDEITAKVKQVRSHLNKLTLEKFDKIFSQILGLDISNIDVLKGIVNEIFEKTLAEPMFAGMYAELCRRLNKHYDENGLSYTDADGRALTFRKVLLGNCQNEFMRFKASSEEHVEKSGDAPKSDSENTDSKEKASDEKDGSEPPSATGDDAKRAKAKADKKAMEAKKRMLGNVRFIGELYKKDLLAEKIVHEKCIVELLKLSITGREDDVIEALCNLLSRTGKKLSENPEKVAKDKMNVYFERLRALSMDHRLPARIRFMLQDLADQRKNGWNLRRDDQSAKTIAEIKEDIKKEERAKEQAAAAAQSRRGGGGRSGGGFGRDRGPPHHASAPRMTIAPVSRQASGNRSQGLMEKYAGRASAASQTSASGSGASVRLGPSNRAGGQWKSAGAGTSLRPGGSGRFSAPGSGGGAPSATGNAFAALESMDSQDHGSGDVRVASRMSSGKGGRWTPSRSGSGDARSSAAAPKPPVEELMPHDKLKRKVSSIVKEYWEIKDMKEVRECLIEEVKAVNYANFVTEVVRLCLESKAADRVKTVPLFEGLIGEPIGAAAMKDGFRPLLKGISDLEMDDPKASNTIAMFLGALSATGKFGGDESDETFGLKFLKEPLGELEDKKKAMKLTVLTFAELEKRIASSVADETERQSKVLSALKLTDLDPKAMALEHNPMRGLESLKDLLADNSAQFLVPMLSLEMELPGKLSSDASGEELAAFVKSCIPESSLGSEALARCVSRLGLAWAFEGQTKEREILSRFSEKCSPLMKSLFGLEDSYPALKTQMGVLLEIQVWLDGASSEFSLADGVKPAYVAFHCLYDVEMVEEEVFTNWKKDTDATQAIPGKSNAVLESSRFFEWLSKADTEE